MISYQKANFIYRKNEEFRNYVKRYIRTKPLTVKQALNHAIVRNCAEYYNYTSNYGDQINLEWIMLRKNEDNSLKKSEEINSH